MAQEINEIGVELRKTSDNSAGGGQPPAPTGIVQACVRRVLQLLRVAQKR